MFLVVKFKSRKTIQTEIALLYKCFKFMFCFSESSNKHHIFVLIQNRIKEHLYIIHDLLIYFYKLLIGLEIFIYSIKKHKCTFLKYNIQLNVDIFSLCKWRKCPQRLYKGNKAVFGEKSILVDIQRLFVHFYISGNSNQVL